MFCWTIRSPIGSYIALKRKYVMNDAEQDNVSMIKLFLKMISKNKSDPGPSVWRHM